jgi:hypothetical protein
MPAFFMQIKAVSRLLILEGYNVGVVLRFFVFGPPNLALIICFTCTFFKVRRWFLRVAHQQLVHRCPSKGEAPGSPGVAGLAGSPEAVAGG